MWPKCKPATLMSCGMALTDGIYALQDECSQGFLKVPVDSALACTVLMIAQWK